MLRKLNIFKRIDDKSTQNIFKNMAVLMSGAVIARIIGFGSTPILTRLYTPEHFGILSIFLAVLAMILPFATLRYSIAIPLLKYNGIAINLVAVSMLILSIVTLITIGIFGLFYPIIFKLFSLETLQAYWWLLPIAVFASGMYEIFQSWLVRQKDFKALATTDVLTTIGGAITKIGLALMGIKPLGLLLGSVFVSSFGSILLFFRVKNLLKINKKFLRFSRMKFLILYYMEYPKYRLPSQFLLVLSMQAPLLALANFFGTDTVGQFSLALMALSLPVTLLGNSMGQAYYAEIAKVGKKNPEKIFEISKHIIKKLLLLSIIPFIVILFASPLLFSFVFGEAWREAGAFAQLLSLYMLASFVSAPLVNTLSVFERQSLFLKLNIIRVGLLLGVFTTVYFLNLGAIETVFLYSMVMAMHFIYVSTTIFTVIKQEIILVKSRNGRL